MKKISEDVVRWYCPKCGETERLDRVEEWCHTTYLLVSEIRGCYGHTGFEHSLSAYALC